MNIQTSMHGKTCMVTGATSGIGLATAEALAERGAKVIVVGRNPAKTALAVEQIKDETGNSDVSCMIADLSIQAEIHELSDDFRQNNTHLDVLINNAGVMRPQREETSEGIEMTFAVNHLAYFLLTTRLLGVLENSPSARIINVASQMQTRLNFDDLQNKERYRGWEVYAQTKFANVLFTVELAKRLQGKPITVNALHPGVVHTNLYPHGMSPDEGAKTSIYLATAEDVAGVTGKYFVKCRPTSPMYAIDPYESRKLWEISETLTGMNTAVV
ncbi:MAG: SDR family oxidoreductase [Aggregatilineales bacterium]